MATKFIGKNLSKKVVRPLKNAVKYGKKSKKRNNRRSI